MKQFGLTFIGLSISIALYLVLVLFDLDLFERFNGVLERIERYEIDELIIPLLIFVSFAFFELRKKKKTLQIELEKVKVFKAMLSSTHHILNNFLNQMQLFKLTAESTPNFDPEVLALYDHIIKDATTQIEALSSITHIDEASIKASLELK